MAASAVTKATKLAIHIWTNPTFPIVFYGGFSFYLGTVHPSWSLMLFSVYISTMGWFTELFYLFHCHYNEGIPVRVHLWKWAVLPLPCNLPNLKNIKQTNQTKPCKQKTHTKDEVLVIKGKMGHTSFLKTEKSHVWVNATQHLRLFTPNADQEKKKSTHRRKESSFRPAA